MLIEASASLVSASLASAMSSPLHSHGATHVDGGGNTAPPNASVRTQQQPPPHLHAIVCEDSLSHPHAQASQSMRCGAMQRPVFAAGTTTEAHHTTCAAETSTPQAQAATAEQSQENVPQDLSAESSCDEAELGWGSGARTTHKHKHNSPHSINDEST